MNQFILFEIDSSSTKWLVGGVLVIAVGTTVTYCYQKVRHRAVIGPYAPADANTITRSIQRMLIDKTRRDLRAPWFVADSFAEHRPRRVSDNGHPLSGAIRDAARRLITNAISAQGWERLEISPGGHSLDQKYADHQHYAVGDLHRGVSEDSWSGKGDVIVGIDIDYYLRDIDYYLTLGKPTIFHTFNPKSVAGVDGDAPFRIKNNTVHYEVGGGGRWVHPVWDWCAYGEFIEAYTTRTWIAWVMSWIGLRKSYYHKIYHSRPWVDCPHRVLVWTAPEYSHWSFSFLKKDVNARRLGRVEYACKHRPGWNTLVYPENGILRISLGREGEDACITINKEDYDIIMGLGSKQSVTTRMIAMKETRPQTLALMGQYFDGKTPPVPEATRMARSSVFVHWPYSSEADEPETTSRTYAGPLLTTPNLMPMTKRWETISQSLEKRVTFVANDKIPGRVIASYMEEFVSLVVPDKGTGIPYELEYVRDQLDKPSQVIAVRQVWETLDVEARRLIESFVKNEPTMKHGRIISSFPDARYLLDFSRYTLSCRDQVLHAEHNRHWFCPGLKPKEIAKMVTQYCQSVGGVIEGDYSNFDGTVSKWLQTHVMNAIYLRWFGNQYREALRAHTGMLINCPARAKKFGFRYEAGVGVKSGSPTTCDLNSVLNASLMYCAIRKTNPLLSKEEAFREIGLAFGDDSLFDRQYQKAWVKTVAAVGMTIKIEVCKPETGVTFLARVFPDPWSTETSFQDPIRTWRKLHLTSRDPKVPIGDAAVDRVDGYLVTDPNTPVTSAYCRMVQRLYPRTEQQEARRLRRKDRLKEKPYWLTVGGSWPQKIEDVDLMYGTISARTGIDEEVLRQQHILLEQLQDLWSVPAMEVEDGYASGVAPDGLPAEPEVDARQISEERAINHARVIPNTSLTNQDGSDQTVSAAQASASGREPHGGRAEGPRQLSEPSRSHNEPTGPGDQVAPQETGVRGIHGQGRANDSRRNERGRGNASQRGRQVRREERAGNPRSSRGGPRGRGGRGRGSTRI
nr:MAG: RNA-dependent RNA polymerase [Wufeng shrew nodavirus 7]